jgi:D-alanine-D-alanine ligase
MKKRYNIAASTVHPMLNSDRTDKKHIAVILGGMSAEREVSLSTGEGVVGALQQLGYRVTPIDVGRDIASILGTLQPDLVFNALHGTFGEDGCIQGALELLGIPYTHSGVLASALALDKLKSRALFLTNDLMCPEAMLVSKSDNLQGDPMVRPYVIKPLKEGSSIGVEVIFVEDDFNFAYGEQVLVEKYIAGREVQVAVIGDKAIGAIEIIPSGRFYDYQAKYTPGYATHVIPAPMSPPEYNNLLAIAEKAHKIIGCRGLSRVDFRYHPNGEFYILEVNTTPGLTPLSLVPEIAAYNNISFAEFLEILIKEAKCDEWP